MKKPKFCKVCKKPFYPHNSLTPICSYKCYEVWTSEKEVKKRVKEMKANLQTLSDLESIAKIAFQAWIRKRDDGKPCISCQTHSSPVWDAGHFYPAGQYSGLIFDETNVHKQCRHCNTFRHGSLIEYRGGLILRYGEQYLKELEDKADRLRNKKWTRDELIAIAKEYKSRMK